MQDFWLYFQIGRVHIADWQVRSYSVCYRSLPAILLKDWKKVLILVTAFTIGHSITLALSVLELCECFNYLDRIPDPCHNCGYGAYQYF